MASMTNVTREARADLSWATEDNLVREFTRVMHEWGFRPFRRGEVALPTRREALGCLLVSRYGAAEREPLGEYVPLP